MPSVVTLKPLEHGGTDTVKLVLLGRVTTVPLARVQATLALYLAPTMPNTCAWVSTRNTST